MAVVLICLFIAGRDLSTFWLPWCHSFFFLMTSVSYPKLEKSWPLKKRLFSDLISKGHSHWLDSLDKLSSKRPKLKDMEDKTAIAKSKGNTTFSSSFSINIVQNILSFFFFCKCLFTKMFQGRKCQLQILTHHVFAQQRLKVLKDLQGFERNNSVR